MSYEKDPKAVVYKPQSVLAACEAVVDCLSERGERPVVVLAVAAMLVKMHAQICSISDEESIGSLRRFLASFELSDAPRN